MLLPINKMRTEGHNLNLLPLPSVSELYPNMKMKRMVIIEN